MLVKTHGTDVAVTAPTPFNLERLFFLGSEKGPDDVGQYGEGFKVAATCLLRDHAVTPIAVSGWDVVCLRVAEHAIANTQLSPVEYDFYHSDHAFPGTLLVLPGCSGRLATAIAHGLTHFFYEDNALLGTKRWSSHSGEFSISDSTDGRGHVFYRKLKRGEIDAILVVLVIDKPSQALKRKISKDRDCNAFGEAVPPRVVTQVQALARRIRLLRSQLIVNDCRHSTQLYSIPFFPPPMWNGKFSLVSA